MVQRTCLHGDCEARSTKDSDYCESHNWIRYSNGEPLTAAMNNVLASRLGRVAREAGNQDRIDVGDSIDRGLILRRLLEEAGFELREKQ